LKNKKKKLEKKSINNVISVKLIFVVILKQNDLDNHDINVTDENIELKAFEEKVLSDYLN